MKYKVSRKSYNKTFSIKSGQVFQALVALGASIGHFGEMWLSDGSNEDGSVILEEACLNWDIWK